MTEPEQITKEPSAAPVREKDPRRVAAGKALQVKNRIMKEEHAKYKAEEAERNKQMKQENEGTRLQRRKGSRWEIHLMVSFHN